VNVNQTERMRSRTTSSGFFLFSHREVYRLVAMFRSAAPILLLLALTSALVSCDQHKALVVLQSKGSGPQVQLEPLAQLVANRTTHLAVDALGNLYWSQETEDGQDLVFVTGMAAVGGANLPLPSALSSVNILAAMRPLTGETSLRSSTSSKRAPTKPGGNIQSLVTGSDGAVYFYFNGGFGPNGAQAIGRFDPRNNEIQIVADTQQLATISGMGRSLDLARGRLLVCGQVIRLFLRHSDAWAILDFEPNRLPTIGQGKLERTIKRIRVSSTSASTKADDPQDESSRKSDLVELTSPEVDLGVGPTISGSGLSAHNGLLLIDRNYGAIFLVDDAGNAKLLASLVSLSQALSRPTVERMVLQSTVKPTDEQMVERILLFAADGPRIDPSVTLRPEPPVNLQVQYPALVMLDPTTGQYTAINRDDIHGPGQFAIYATKLQQLVPIGKNSFVGYDASSGQVLKVNVTGR
jgi:hypothetical protein